MACSRCGRPFRGMRMAGRAWKKVTLRGESREETRDLPKQDTCANRAERSEERGPGPQGPLYVKEGEKGFGMQKPRVVRMRAHGRGCDSLTAECWKGFGRWTLGNGDISNHAPRVGGYRRTEWAARGGGAGDGTTGFGFKGVEAQEASPAVGEPQCGRGVGWHGWQSGFPKKCNSAADDPRRLGFSFRRPRLFGIFVHRNFLAPGG